MKARISETEEISQADQVAAVVSGVGKNTVVAAVRPVAYRVPVYLLASVDAMAAEGKKSRNAMLNMLVQVGIDEVREKLGQDVVERLLLEESKALQFLMGEELESLQE